MRGTYVHFRLGVALAEEDKAALISEWLTEVKQLRLVSFPYAQDALDYIAGHRPHLVIADYERFGAAGVHGLANLISHSGCPVILICRDISDWEREQFAILGVHAWFEGKFKLTDLSRAVDSALKRPRRIGSSDRLPVVAR